MTDKAKPAKPARRQRKTGGKVQAISAALVERVCERVANGETLTAVLRDPGMPSWSSFHRRINSSYDLRAAVARAREAGYARMADDLLEIAEDGRNDYVERQGRNGKPFIALNDEHVRRSQLRIDTRKWLLSKVLPARFGERVEHTGAGGGPIQHEHAISKAMLDNLATLRARLPALPAAAGAGPQVIDATPVGGD